jgi:hypothetical protein
MDYELYLRARQPSANGAQELQRSLEAEPERAPGGQDALARLELPDGVLEVRLHPWRSEWWEEPCPQAPTDGNAEPYGVDLRIPGGANPRLAETAVARAFQWAERHDLTVYDPQLGREVRPRDADAIRSRIARLAEYLTDTVGMHEGQAAAQINVEPRRAPLPLRTRFYLALGALLVLLAVLSRYC